MTLAALHIPKPSKSDRMSYVEFLSRDFENNHVEWVNGEIIQMPPISGVHSDLDMFLATLINAFVDHHALGTVRREPYQMKTGPHLPSRAPDLLFVTAAHKKRLKKTHLEGPADLVVEIIGPESASRDRGEKFHEYEAGGVPEFWLIDPASKQAEFYLRDKKGIFQLQQVGADGIYKSTVLVGLWLKVPWLWKRPLPSVINIMRDWKLV